MSCRSADTDLTLSVKTDITFPFCLSFLISILHFSDRTFLAERFQERRKEGRKEGGREGGREGGGKGGKKGRKKGRKKERKCDVTLSGIAVCSRLIRQI